MITDEAPGSQPDALIGLYTPRLPEEKPQPLPSQPGHGEIGLGQAGSHQQRVVGALLEAHRDLALSDCHVGDSVDKIAEDMLGLGGRIAVAEPLYSHPAKRARGLICDQHIELTGFYSKQGYPMRLRRIRFKDPETGKTLVFLTNHLGILAARVCTLYKNRWQVELFFKWIKQHLRIKRFFGTSENAVKSQASIAVATYVLFAIIKKRLNLDLSLHAMLQILSVTPFEKHPCFNCLPKWRCWTT
jgi:hypothetical protein